MAVRRIRRLGWYVYMIVRGWCVTRICAQWKRDADLLQDLKGMTFDMNLNARNAAVPAGLICALLAAVILAGCNNTNSSATSSARAAAPSTVPVAVAAARRMDF